MGAPKLKPEDNLHAKRIIEALRERLNEKIAKDEKMAKKAAMILEMWLKKSKP